MACTSRAVDALVLVKFGKKRKNSSSRTCWKGRQKYVLYCRSLEQLRKRCWADGNQKKHIGLSMRSYKTLPLHIFDDYVCDSTIPVLPFFIISKTQFPCKFRTKQNHLKTFTRFSSLENVTVSWPTQNPVPISQTFLSCNADASRLVSQKA